MQINGRIYTPKPSRTYVVVYSCRPKSSQLACMIDLSREETRTYVSISPASTVHPMPALCAVARLVVPCLTDATPTRSLPTDKTSLAQDSGWYSNRIYIWRWSVVLFLFLLTRIYSDDGTYVRVWASTVQEGNVCSGRLLADAI